MAILYEVTSTKQCQQVAMIKQPTEYSNICSTFRAISGLNYWSVFYWVEMLLITEKPLFILFFFFNFFFSYLFIYLIYVTAFTWTILINRLSFPYFFLQGFAFCQENEMYHFKNWSSELCRMKLSLLQH